MKILSYNINGIKSFLSKGGLDYIKSINPDIICFQETRTKTMMIDLDGYHKIYSPGITGAGVCIYSKIKPLKIYETDLKYPGRIIICKFNKFTLFNIYSPYYNDILKNYFLNVHTRFRFDAYLNEMIYKIINSSKKKTNVIIAGDLNVARNIIDIERPNEKLPGFTPEERTSFERIIFQNNLIDTFRIQNPDKKEYSFYSYRSKYKSGMRLDYFLTNFKFKSSIIDKVFFSDHLPIILELN